MPAIEQRNRKFGISGFKPGAFGDRARSRAELQSQIPQVLRKFANRFLESLFGAISSVQKQHVNIGKGEKPAPSESTQCYHRKIRRSVRFRVNVLLPKTLDNGFDQRGPAQQRGPAVAVRSKLLLNARQFLRRYLAQFAGN